MKRTKLNEHGKEITVIVWGDHWPGCEKCRAVNLSKPATLASACPDPGAQLLKEELRKRQAPVVTKARKEVEEWAKKTGAFTEFDNKVKDARKITRYKGEADEGR